MPIHDDLGPVPLSYAPPSLAAKRRTHWITWLVLGLLLFFVAISLYFTPGIGSPRERSNRIKCASNLRQIGQAILMYANDHAGAYPAAFSDLLDEDVKTEIFTCPATTATPSTGSTTQEFVESLQSPGHFSYVYTGASLNSKSPANAVLAYEPISNHPADPAHSLQTGANFLFADGSTQWLPAAQATAKIAALQKGINPPP